MAAPQTHPQVHEVETLVVGAGLIGSSVAMHLAERGMPGVRAIDFDLEGSLSSSELNAGGVRATWVNPLNVAMSKATIEVFAANASETGYRACGYLWLHSPERLAPALAARERQVAAGWPVEAWDVAELKRRVPFLNKTDGIAGALFAPRDGLVNPNLVKNWFRARARAAGAAFDDRTWLRSCAVVGGHFEAAAERMDGVLHHDAKLAILSGGESPVARTPVLYRAKRVVNCAGAWAGAVARALGYSSPCFPQRRQISLFDCRDVDLTPYGMIVDTSGVYFHPEATNGLAGFAVPGEPRGVNFEYEGDRFFNEVIWPALYGRSSAFERLKHVTGWAGQYEVSPDECAILGAAAGGAAPGLFEAHSFSGHGVMHSDSAGAALAELLVDGRYSTFDASPLSGARFETGRTLSEGWVI